MLTRYAFAFLMVAGSACAASPVASEPLVRGKTTVADVEQSLGAPADTAMRPDGALTLVYAYSRCAKRMPASFPAVHGSDANARTVSLHFGPDFKYRSAAIISLTTASAGEFVPATTLASK